MERLLQDTVRKNRIPARLDAAQSISGLILGLFMWVHMLLVASILLGKGSFNFVAKMMEGAFLSSTGDGFPVFVFLAVTGVFALFIIHAALGMRKFPAGWNQFKILRSHVSMLNHGDTTMWAIQAITGFFMFFLGSAHLFIMWTNPGSIDPYLSADRVYSHSLWALYLPLLVCVELHGTIGLYRLAVKWGLFMGKDARKTRLKLKSLKLKVTAGFLAVGALALITFLVIGFNHRHQVGERYHASIQTGLNTVATAAFPAAPAITDNYDSHN